MWDRGWRHVCEHFPWPVATFNVILISLSFYRSKINGTVSCIRYQIKSSFHPSLICWYVFFPSLYSTISQKFPLITARTGRNIPLITARIFLLDWPIFHDCSVTFRDSQLKLTNSKVYLLMHLHTLSWLEHENQIYAILVSLFSYS